MIICILGRQPELGLAELESRFGAAKVTTLGAHAARVTTTPNAVPAHLLGGVVKIAQPLTTVDSLDWPTVLDACRSQLLDLTAKLPDGKLKLGLSAYDLPFSLTMLQRGGLELKKTLREAGRSARVIPNAARELNSAQVLHNQLTSELGIELLLIGDGTRTHLARTFYVQAIDDYARRDFARPRRDARVGMLPPKLAQMMLNLAQVRPGQRVLDPFCGTGVVPQEAALMGCAVYGTDNSERMVSYTRDNLEWLKRTTHISFDARLEVADATRAAWQPPINHVVTETYLGQPLTALPAPAQLARIMAECDTIARAFLCNLRPQLAANARCCIAVPAWSDGRGFQHLDLVDDLGRIGYNQVSFAAAGNQPLVYHRPGQIVARELLVLKVKEPH